ncbi:MAG TPA: hypothetical protein VK590_12005 [Saprospiraceae bacterium]|nr:hypothetical protein [Saprospiraceae bacterium]
MNTLQKIEGHFDLHLRSVEELVSFDRHILDVCITHIEQLNEKLRKGPPIITNQSYLAEGTLKTIKNIRENDSLRTHYLSMFNSCLVLQVSYFTSIVDDIFKHTCYCLNFAQNRQDLDIDILKSKNDINFQNMNSTIKTYNKYLGIEIERDTICNTIILAQSSRHAIVHSLSRADQKFIDQTEASKPRDIKHNFILNEKIQFTTQELDFIKLAMQVFISNLCDKIKNKHQVK